MQKSFHSQHPQSQRKYVSLCSWNNARGMRKWCLNRKSNSSVSECIIWQYYAITEQCIICLLNSVYVCLSLTQNVEQIKFKPFLLLVNRKMKPFFAIYINIMTSFCRTTDSFTYDIHWYFKNYHSSSLMFLYYWFGGMYKWLMLNTTSQHTHIICFKFKY